jgi:phosphomannomutase
LQGLKFVAPDSLFVSPEVCAQMYLLNRAPARPVGGHWHAVARDESWNERHVEAIAGLELLRGVHLAGMRVALDTVCGAGGPIMALLLRRLGAEVTT